MPIFDWRYKVVSTSWKKVLERSGRTQRSLASALRINIVEVNMVAQGRAFLTPPKFAAACELLECNPTDIYDADVLALMYGVGAVEQLPRKDKFAHVRLATDVRYIVDKVAEEEHLNRSQAANAIIRRAFETRRVEP